MTTNQQNWAGNITFSAARIHQPETVEQLQELVALSSKLKAPGSRHSFNDIADSTGDHISLEKLEPTLAFDHERRTVTVNGSITYGQLCQQLHAAGYALHNMASLPHITVAGAIATATHGSGDDNGCLAAAVAALELVTANSELIVLSRDQHKEEFEGAVVALGGLGVVTKVTLDVVPTYVMQQEVYENLPLAQLIDHFDDIAASAYSVSLFTDWQMERVIQVWLKRRVSDNAALAMAPEFFGATLSQTQHHPVVGLPAEACTEQMGIHGPWHERLPHFRVDHTPASGDELQSEYFVPRPHAVAALAAMYEMQEQIAPRLVMSEVRTVAADPFWMSPFYQKACVAIHFSWKKNWPEVQQLLPVIEEQLAPFQARPHWGKLFTMSPAHLQSLYPKLLDFQKLLQSYDPTGKFRNAYLDKYIFGAPTPESMTGEEALDKLAAEVLASTKYSAVDESLIRALGASELARRGSFKEAVKATKTKLHQIARVYLPGKVEYDKWLASLAAARSDPMAFRRACANIMAHHTSTQERLPILDEFYRTIFAGLPPITRLVDLACGLNPLAIPWMDLPPDVSYYACDIFNDQIDFLNDFFALVGIDGRADVIDLLNRPWPISADVALLLKTVPCLEQIDKDILHRLFRTLDARVLIISFPVHSLGGRRKGMPGAYAANFLRIWERFGGDRWSMQKFEFSTELVFRLFNRSPIFTHTEPV